MDLLKARFQYFLQLAFGPAGQNLGHECAADLKHIKGKIGRCLAKRDDAQMVGLFVART
jgi:hypothetical protein